MPAAEVCGKHFLLLAFVVFVSVLRRGQCVILLEHKTFLGANLKNAKMPGVTRDSEGTIYLKINPQFYV